MAKMTNTRTMTGSGTGPTVEDMGLFIAGLNPKSTITVKYSPGDAREAGQWTLSVSGDDLFGPKKPSVTYRNSELPHSGLIR